MNNNYWNRLLHIIIVLFTIINIIFIGVNIGMWIGTIRANLIPRTDFSYFYTAYSIVRNGEAAKLYDMQTQALYQHEMLNLNTEVDFLPFLYPPFVALFLSVLSALPLNIAYCVWSLIQFGLLIWLIFLLNRIFSDWSKRERVVLSITLLAFWPLAITFIIGQFSLITLFCLCQMYLAMKSLKTTKAGFWLGLLMIKPQTILFPGMITINKRFWRIAGTAVIIFLILVAFSSIFLGFKPWIDYVRLIPTMNTHYGDYGFYPIIEYTLKGMLSNLLGYAQGNLVSIISVIFLVLGMLVTLYLWVPDMSSNGLKFKLQFAIMATLSVFLSLHAYPHDSLVLVLPAAIFYDYLREKNSQRKIYSLLILASPLIFFVTSLTSLSLFGFIRPSVIVILVLLIWMVYSRIRDFRKAKNSPVTQSMPS